MVNYDLQRPAPINLILPCRTHLLMAPQPPKALPSAEEQVLKIWVCWGHVTFKSYSTGHFPTSQVVRFVAWPDMGTTQQGFRWFLPPLDQVGRKGAVVQLFLCPPRWAAHLATNEGLHSCNSHSQNECGICCLEGWWLCKWATLVFPFSHPSHHYPVP